MRPRRRGQIGLEYMMIFAFALMITLPFIFYFFFYTSGPSAETDTYQAQLVARRIVDNAEVAYSLGEGARTTVRVHIPSTVMDSAIMDNSVVFAVYVRGGTSEVAYPSEVNLNGTLPNSSGTYRIHIEAFQDYVNLSYS
ncbi:hypothetical protein J4439_04220 [Candidatus Woesearchaeota archaeon]|nr:hypothetical protein [Candidatus Woesearchaeota archaeon]